MSRFNLNPASISAERSALVSDKKLVFSTPKQIDWLKGTDGSLKLDRKNDVRTAAVIKELHNIIRLGSENDSKRAEQDLCIRGTIIDAYANRLRQRFPSTLFMPATFFNVLTMGVVEGQVPAQTRQMEVYRIHGDLVSLRPLLWKNA